MNSSNQAKHSVDSAGIALVITLGLIVLVTIVVVAFFSRATANRQSESSRWHRVQAEQLTNSAVDYIAGRFQDEIVTGSDIYTTSNVSIYSPKAAANAIPKRIVSNDAGVPGFETLIRQSIAAADPNASADSTATASRNGRTVGPTRWNAPFLTTGAGFSTTSQLPNWVYLNLTGNVTKTPNSSVIGRFAYNVYQLDGLLDANAIGYAQSGPGSLSTAEVRQIKGTLAGADLTQIPGIPTVSAATSFVNWRNPNTASSPGTYLNGVTKATGTGFLISDVNDTRFTGRQDLIRLARTENFGITPIALPYFTTFSREINAPSWSPSEPPANRVGSGSTSYVSNANNSSTVNRFAPNVRAAHSFTTSYYADDGTSTQISIQAGDSLLQRRFSLSYLRWLGRNGLAAGGTAQNVKACFGLKWAAGSWEYIGSTGVLVQTRIKRLDEVASEDRLPNFFETLKAAILSGSLGKVPGVARQGGQAEGIDQDLTMPSHSANENQDANIIQIGANILDQYDPDSYPSTFTFANDDIYGQENLPYITRVGQIVYFENAPTARTAYTWITPELWAPYQPAPTGESPTQLRVLLNKGVAFVRAVVDHGKDPATGLPYANPPNVYASDGPPMYFADPETTQVVEFPFTAGLFHAHPFFPTKSKGATDSPAVAPAAEMINHPDDVAFSMGQVVYTYQGPPASITTECSATPLTFSLQCLDGTVWRTYSQVRNVVEFGGIGTGEITRNQIIFAPGRPDPRTDRLGTSLTVALPSIPGYTPLNTTMRPSKNNAGTLAVTHRPQTGAGFRYPIAPIGFNSSGAYMGRLSENRIEDTSETISYSDPDGIVRRADSAYATGTTDDGFPLSHTATSTNTQARGIVLNRPFRSVGELGYTFRDLPFKSLDFQTAESADAGLLDFFSISAGPELQAGRVNPSVAPRPVLKAILNGAARKEISGNLLTATEADAVAGNFINFINTQGPLLNRAELVTRYGAVAGAALADNAFVSNKTEREVAVRSLAEFANTRTWNLLFDVVAQTGKQNTTFLVEAEKRYWVSVAIDRYTGKIVDQQWEAVHE